MNITPARVRAFVGGSATASNNVEGLRTFYASLSVEGWLIELARAHGRALLGSWSHEEFAAWIGMRGNELAREYRRMLKLADNDREELVQLARRILAIGPLRHTNDSPHHDITPLQKSGEMMRFRRARENVERRASNIGRPCVACDVDGPLGKQLEAWRLELKIGVEDWAAGLGITALTYRARLAREREANYRNKINQLIKDGKQLYARMSVPVVAHYDVVSRDEITAAYKIVGDDIEAIRRDLLRDGMDTPMVNDSFVDQSHDDEPFLPLDLYSWMRDPNREEESTL